jgi:hypothetical protein
MFTWDGHSLSPSFGKAVTVKYHGATNTRGSRWVASVKRDRHTTWRASATYQDGPIAAFNALRRKYVADLGDWTVAAVGSLDSETYVLLLRVSTLNADIHTLAQS